MSISDFLDLTIMPGRLKMQKESCRTYTFMVRRRDEIRTSMLHFTRNITQLWRILQIMAKVVLIMTLKLSTLSKKLRLVSGWH